MFVYNKEKELFECEISGIEFVCEEEFAGCEEYAINLADAYLDKIDKIVDFMISEEIETYFGEMTPDKLISALGKPQIDVGRSLITYLEHTLDSIHIIEIEFSGVFEKMLYMTIDG